jgi:putative oxidoreductase
MPLPMLSYLITIVVEVIGGLLLLVGYQTRIASLALQPLRWRRRCSSTRNFADQNQMIHFLKNISIIGGLLQVAAFGAGALSVDARRLRTA